MRIFKTDKKISKTQPLITSIINNSMTTKNELSISAEVVKKESERSENDPSSYTSNVENILEPQEYSYQKTTLPPQINFQPFSSDIQTEQISYTHENINRFDNSVIFPHKFNNPTIQVYPSQLLNPNLRNHDAFGNPLPCLVYTHSIIVPCYKIVYPPINTGLIKIPVQITIPKDLNEKPPIQIEKNPSNENIKIAPFIGSEKESTFKNDFQEITHATIEEKEKIAFKILLSHTSNKIKYFPHLLNLLVKIFLNEEIKTHECDLTFIETLLFIQIVKRKFPNIVIQAKLNDSGNGSEVLKIVQKLKVHPSTKKLEDNIKFVYHLTMEHIKLEFLKNRPSNDTTREPVTFVEHYFSDLIKNSDSNNEVLKNEFIFKLKNESNKFINVNSEYLGSIVKSDLLMNEVVEFLKSPQLLKDYQNKILKIFETLFLKFEKILKQHPNILLSDKKMKEFMEYNVQYRLPWTTNEIIFAIDMFLSSLFQFKMDLNS